MPMPMPKTIAEEISGAILDLLRKDLPLYYSLSEFEVKRAGSLIDELQKYNPPFAHSFRGSLCSISGEVEKAMEEHGKAVALAPDDTTILCNYGVSLMRLGRYKDAENMYIQARKVSPGSVSALNDLLVAAYYADDFERIGPLLESWKKLTGEIHDVAIWLEEDAEDEAEIPDILAEAERKGYTSLNDLKKELGSHGV